MPPGKIGVGILGATGMVGQRFLLLLQDHPLFVITALGASPRSAGKVYAEAVSWKLAEPMPPAMGQMRVRECRPAAFPRADSCAIVFSGLDASVAGEVEMAFVREERAVFSNAKNHRMHPQVPLVVPLVNPRHLDIIPRQREAFGVRSGFLVTNANCSTTGLSVVLGALKEAFGPLARVIVTTMQAVSGAGYPGVPSLDILGNVVPYISGEEEKVEEELFKIVGDLATSLDAFHPCPRLRVSASCNRVPVIDGHTESVHVEFASSSPPPTADQVRQVLRSFRTGGVDGLSTTLLTSMPNPPIVVRDEVDRPQPRLDLHAGAGHAVVVGRIRPCPVFHIKFTLLAHNTVLGAAGSAVMNAEMAVARGFIAHPPA